MTFTLLISVKMPTIAVILTFISRINTASESFKATEQALFFTNLPFMSCWNFILSRVEQEYFISSRPGPEVIKHFCAQLNWT